MKKIGRLHVITDTELQDRFTHTELAKMAIAGGADTLQFRQKIGSTREMIETARQMKQLCTNRGVTFIVNDRLDVAIASDSDGVHLGQDDFPIPLGRDSHRNAHSRCDSVSSLQHSNPYLAIIARRTDG